MIIWESEKIFITGGAGFLGRELVKRLYDHNDIVVYSRDEAKHYYLKKEYPKIKTVIGDVRNYDLMKRVAVGCSRGIYAASVKQIEACDENPEEANEIIIKGAFNSRRVSEELGMKSGTFISTDKSRAATTIYGAMKFVAGESFILNRAENAKTSLSTVVYGNVLNSTGSIIPLILSSIKNNLTLSLYSEQMTRFMICGQEAVDLVLNASQHNGTTIVPNLKSFRIKDLFEIYSRFGLKYNVGNPRVGEKLHEIMIAPEEIMRTSYVGKTDSPDYFIIHPKKISNTNYKFNNNEYSSRDHTVCREELDKILADKNYFL